MHNKTTPNEFRSLWLPDSKSEICFQFDKHSDFWIDWDDGNEPEHIAPNQYFHGSERRGGTSRLEEVIGNENLLTIHHLYKDRPSSEPVSISIRGHITDWKAGLFNHGDYRELRKYIHYDNEPCHLISIDQFGPVGLGYGAFLNCRELIRLPDKDIPDSRYLTDMSYMFCNATRFNTSLSHWDVSNVTNMAAVFTDAEYFDQPLNNWDVSNVEDMSGMFKGAWNFDQPLNNWDVSHVTNMVAMFKGAEYFDQPLNNWDVSNVVDMREMFYDAYNFDQPLSKWNVSHVKSMHGMFSWALRFNHPLNKWDVSNVEDMREMFFEAAKFDQPLHKWDVSNVKNISAMLHGSPAARRSLRQWKLPKGIKLSSLFEF